ncbi:MAG: hypothetical protein IJL04_04215, partial [Bacteroidales bacterium]|nr:hypothetical protein [Bacteroidales bacterium]
EISIGYGFHPVSGDYFGMDAMRFNYWIDKVGAIYGSYTHFFNKVVGVGGTYCFDPRIIDYTYNGIVTNNPMVCTLNESCHSVMGHLKLNCINKKHFVLYTKFDAGICFWGYKLKEYQPEYFGVEFPDQHCCFAWQAAAGIEVGNERIAGFAQCGVGMEGSYSIGIRYKFNK